MVDPNRHSYGGEGPVYFRERQQVPLEMVHSQPGLPSLMDPRLRPRGSHYPVHSPPFSAKQDTNLLQGHQVDQWSSSEVMQPLLPAPQFKQNPAVPPMGQPPYYDEHAHKYHHVNSQSHLVKHHHQDYPMSAGVVQSDNTLPHLRQYPASMNLVASQSPVHQLAVSHNNVHQPAGGPIVADPRLHSSSTRLERPRLPFFLEDPHRAVGQQSVWQAGQVQPRPTLSWRQEHLDVLESHPPGRPLLHQAYLSGPARPHPPAPASTVIHRQPHPSWPGGEQLQPIPVGGAVLPTVPQPHSQHQGHYSSTSLQGSASCAESSSHNGRGQSSIDTAIQNWLQEVGRRKPQESSRKQIKLGEVRSRLVKGSQLLSQLKSINNQLRGDNLPERRRQELLKDAQECKVAFQEVRVTLDAAGVKEHFMEKTKKIKSRREGQRRRWQERRHKWQQRKKILVDRTDQWVKERQETELKTRMERDVKASVSEVLGAVKQKMHEVREMVRMVEALSELREVRREASRKKGDGPPIEADEKFENTRTSLVELLNQQVGVYEKEDHALRVIMEQEVKDKMERKKEVKAAVGVVDDVIKEEEESMAAVPTEDPLEPYRHFYQQALHSPGLQAIRSNWDLYRSPVGSPLPNGPLKLSRSQCHKWSTGQLQKKPLATN